MSVICDKYGFFNGTYGMEQTNWANYWKGVVPDGVVANSGGSGAHKEMEVYLSGGLTVAIAPGECMADNHKGWISNTKTMTLSAADASDPRIDSVIIRVVYGNEEESYIELDILEGTPGADPDAPTLTQVTGETYEYALANIYVAANAVNLTDANLTDLRYVFSMGSGSVTDFAETRTTDADTQEPIRYCELQVADGREYRATNTITNTFSIILPENPVSTFMCAVDFTSGTETVDRTTFTFQGVNFYLGSTSTSYSVKTSNMVTSVGSRYNLLIWWDGAYYWCDCKAV